MYVNGYMYDCIHDMGSTKCVICLLARVDLLEMYQAVIGVPAWFRILCDAFESYTMAYPQLPHDVVYTDQAGQ